MGYDLWTPKELRQGIALSVAAVISSFLELLAVACIFPFINILIQPESLQTNSRLANLYARLGSPALEHLMPALGLVLIGIILVGTACKWLFIYALNLYVAACQTRLACDLLKRCIHAPYAWFLSRNSTVLSRLIYEDALTWSRSFIQRTLISGNDVVSSLLALGLVITLSPKIGLIAFAVISALALLGFAFVRPILRRWSMIKRKAVDDSMLSVQQALAGMRDVKLSSRESFFIGLFERSFDILSKVNSYLTVGQETPGIILVTLGQLTLIGISLTFWRIGLTPGQIAAQLALLVIVISKIIPSISNISRSWTILANALPQIEGIHAILESIESSKALEAIDNENKLPIHNWHTLQASEISYRYPDTDEWALQKISLTLERAGYYAFVGRSGAGKSTLVDILVGLLEPSEGRLLIDGRSLHEFDRRTWQQRIGYVSQSPYILDDTLRANIAFGVAPSAVDEAWLDQCIRTAHLTSLVQTLPDGASTRLGERGIRFSGGQRQRIAIARALYCRPDVLIFDEATSALDAITEREILETLKELRGQMTLFIIAHRLTMIMDCDKIFVLDHGRLAGEGTYHTLQANVSVFQQMASEFGRTPVQPLS